MDVIVESDRDRRTLEWLVSEVGVDAVEQVCSQLAGERKPYVSNVAKALGLEPPECVRFPTQEEARARLANLKEILKSGEP
jgi:hypothetical protein